jgi:hypothetical protein
MYGVRNDYNQGKELKNENKSNATDTSINA